MKREVLSNFNSYNNFDFGCKVYKICSKEKLMVHVFCHYIKQPSP